MTERDIQNILYRHLKKLGHTMITPNAKYVFWGQENDLISVTKSGLIHEFEIKLSKADFFADFKKEHGKHDKLRERTLGIPSYFWFVTHGFDYNYENVPEYAGAIGISANIRFDGCAFLMIEIDAPRLHKDKITQKQKDGLLRVNNNKLWLERMRNEHIPNTED